MMEVFSIVQYAPASQLAWLAIGQWLVSEKKNGGYGQ
jgi:hypothetical protein